MAYRNRPVATVRLAEGSDQLLGEAFADSFSLPRGRRNAILLVMNAMVENSEAAILDRVFRPDAGGWPRAAAEAILGVGFSEGDREKMLALLEKAGAEGLSADEATALENYRHIGRLLELMKSKARQSLRNAPT